jgi:hypothetical protein
MIKQVLAVVGATMGLGFILHMLIVMIIAGFNGYKITLDFNRLHEYWPELAVTVLAVGLGIWSTIYIMMAE